MKEASTSAVSRLMNLSWNAIDGILQRAVKRGLSRREALCVTQIGVDETAFRKRHDYVVIVSDQESRTVLHVGGDRKKETLKAWFESLTGEQREAIESVSMDMWPAFINATLESIPGAIEKIAFDKFHVARYLGEAVDKVRRQEHKALMAEGYEDLKGSKYDWLYNPRNMTRKQEKRFKALRDSTPKTARAWAIKEVAKTIKEHLWGILNAIVLKVSNGPAEGLNSRIKMIKVRSRGFRNKERFANAIYFHLGGLDLYPEGVVR